MPADPYQILLAGVAGFASAGFIRWWQYRRDLWISEIERFTDTLDEAIENSTEYWLRPIFKKDDKRFSEENNFEARLREVNLLGLQARLDGFYECFIDRITYNHRITITDRLNSLSFAMTGGEFQSADREADYERAQLVQANAADLLIAVRLAIAYSLSGIGTLKITIERFWLACYNLAIMTHHDRRRPKRK